MKEPTHVTISIETAKRLKYILRKDLEWLHIDDGDDIDGSGKDCPHKIKELKESLDELREAITKAREDAMTYDFFKE